MVTCVVFGCTNRSDSDAKSKGITFHVFPKNESRKALWENAVRRKNWRASKWSTICSQHFREEDIDRTSLSTVRLRENAVPSVFPTHPKHLQKVEEPEVPAAVIAPGGKCFVCGKAAGPTGSPMAALTTTTKIQFHQKLGRVIGAELDLVVDEDGILCHGCCRLLNYMDRIEVEHRLLTKSILDCMRRTLGLGYIQGDNHMPEAVLTSIENCSKNSRIPAEKHDICLGLPEKGTSNEAVSRSKTVTSKGALLRSKTVAPSEKKNQTLVIARGPEKKTDAEQDKQNYQCKICNFQSKHKSVFLFHLQRHLQSSYRCDFCCELLPKDLNYWIAKMQKQAM